jgi:hypothetical protein
MWTLFCCNYCLCSLLALPAKEGYHFCGIVSVVPLYRSSSTPNRKIYTVWLMPAPGRCQSVDDWTIVGLVLTRCRGSAVNCRPTGSDHYQPVPRWNRQSSKFTLHASRSPVHRWSIYIASPQSRWSMSISSPQSRWYMNSYKVYLAPRSRSLGICGPPVLVIWTPNCHVNRETG